MECSKGCGWPLKEFQDVIHGVAAGMIRYPDRFILIDKIFSND